MPGVCPQLVVSWRYLASVRPLSVPAILSAFSPRVDRVAWGPKSMPGVIVELMCTASVASSPVFIPIIRFTQPTRCAEPGSASSISSIAAKCDRFGWFMPTAWTAANLPEFHQGISGASCAFRPNIASFASSGALGSASLGRAA